MRPALVLGGQHVAIADDAAARLEALDHRADAVALARVEVEVDVPGEDVGDGQGELGVLAGVGEGLVRLS